MQARDNSSRQILSLMLFVIGICTWAGASASSLDTIIIDRGKDEPIRIAVVPFKSDPSLFSEVNIADIVGFDLARSGQFDPLASENMLSHPSQRQEVFFRDWRVLKAAYLVVGNARVAVDGRIQVNFELYDVAAEALLMTRQYSMDRSQWRDTAHRIADVVYEEVTGIRGAFNTKIMYVLAQNSGSPDATYSLEIADSDGERSRTLFSSREPILSANWAPDGKRVAYVTYETGRPTIVIQDIDGPYRERLTNFRGINSSPVFSPDGSKLALVLSKDGDPEIFVMDLASRQLRQITRHHAIDTEPAWAPDGESIVFTSDRGGRPQIYLVELDNNFLERLTYRGNYNARARFMPNGKDLIYVHRQNGVFHVVWHDLARDYLQVLTQTQLDESPSLAPNGAMLIYATQDRGRGILAVVSIDGSVKYRLPSSSGDVREPAWSPFID